jgi:hypothetical protein
LFLELAIGNIVRRVLYIIRHECAAIIKEKQSGTDGKGQLANVNDQYIYIYIYINTFA